MKINIFKSWLIFFLLSNFTVFITVASLTWIIYSLNIDYQTINLLKPYLLIICCIITISISYLSYHLSVSKFILNKLSESGCDIPQVNFHSFRIGSISIFLIAIIIGAGIFLSNSKKEENRDTKFNNLQSEHRIRKSNLNSYFNSINSFESMDIKIVSEILNKDHSRVGQSSETILVDSNHKTIGTSRFGSPDSFEVPGNIIEIAISGKSGQAVENDYRGIEVLKVYSSIEVFSKRLAVITQIDLSEAEH